jgi:hypothetical protein
MQVAILRRCEQTGHRNSCARSARRLESYTALANSRSITKRVRLGTPVTGMSYRATGQFLRSSGASRRG